MEKKSTKKKTSSSKKTTLTKKADSNAIAPQPLNPPTPNSDNSGNETPDDYDELELEGDREGIQLTKLPYKKIIVDLWKTELHTALMGIHHKDLYRAQSREFTEGLKIMGVIEFFPFDPNNENFKPLERKEMLAINDTWWNLEDNENELASFAKKFVEDNNLDIWKQCSRRMVLKTFTQLESEIGKKTEAGRWRGTLEESQLLGSTMIFGGGHPRPFFYVNMPGYYYRIAIFRVSTRHGERWTFSLLNPKTHELSFFTLRKRFFDPGLNYDVYNAITGDKVAFLDNRVGNIGGRIDIVFRTEPRFQELTRSSVFRRVLILFSALIKYIPEINKKYALIYKLLRQNKKFRENLAKMVQNNQTPVNMKDMKQQYETMVKEGKMIRSIEIPEIEMSLHYKPWRG